MKLSEIAKLVNGKVITGKDIDIKGVATPESATEEDIIFITGKKYIDDAKKSKAGALIVKEKVDIDKPQIIVKSPERAIYTILNNIYKEENKGKYISKTAIIGKNVKIGEDVYIGDYVVIEDNVEIGKNTKIYPFTFIGKNTKIGEDVIIHPRVTIYKDTEIGSRVILHSGVVIAGDGFGYYQEDGKHIKINHIGKVIIEDDVEIGANTTIDRAMIDKTVIKEGTKIDNLVMVGHNCKIGKNTILVSQVGIAGSCNIGNNVILAGQVGVADHINISDGVIVTAKSGVGKNLEKPGVYGANIPAVEWSKWKKILIYLYKLPELVKKLK